MGSTVTFSHDDIDPSSIQSPIFGHDDIDPSSIQKPSPGFLATAAKAINSVTISPIDAAILAHLKGQPAWDAYKKQFANMTDEAPTGKDVMTQAGLSPDPSSPRLANADNNFSGPMSERLDAMKMGAGSSPAGVAGAISDQVLDPINYVAPAAKIVGKAVAPVTDAISSGLKNFAEDAAVSATGATGKQASTFAQDAGRQLLDRGIVKFGNSQKQIAQNASDAVDAANSQIDAALKKLDANGTRVNAQDIYDTVRQTINKMKADPSKADIANNLENELNNVIAGTDATGTTKYGMQEAENIKRGYNRKAGNWADPEKSQAGKEMYQTYRGAVEDAATQADPQTAAAFIEGKKTHGLLAPIQEAAERRALVTNQHPAGGLLDMAAMVAGEGAGNPGLAIGAPIARRLISPRIASSVAVGADQGANMINKIPQVMQSIPNAAGPAAAIGSQVLGHDKWAADGFQNLKSHVGDEDRQWLEDNKGALMADPKTKNLLVTGSQFKPGDKPLDDVFKHLKNRIK